MDGVQYNYMGKKWRSCPTEAEGNCFFNSAFGTRNSEDQPFRDRYAKFRRMYWSTFLTYYSDGDLAGALLELLKNCFIANDRYQQKSIENVDNYTDYVQDITVSDYWVQVEEIPLLAALWNIRIILFIGDRDKPEVFDPNPELLGKFPFHCINAVRDVVICLVDNHFSRLEPHDRSEEITSAINKVTVTQNQDSNIKKSKMPCFNRRKHYKKRGSAGIEGGLYQINLLTMVLLNGIKKVKNWRLSTEDEDAAKFDDLIFEFLPSESAILLQAKRKKNEKRKVTYEDLVSANYKNEFSLPKYFFSYQEILVRNKFKVQNIVICTNLDLDESAKKYLKQESPDAENILYFHGADNICYSFKGCCLPLLKKNIKTYYAENVQNKKVMITDEAIEDFLAHLQFFPNYLGEEYIDSAVEKTVSSLSLSVNLDSKAIFKDIHKKMLDWFKEETGRYLTEVDAKGFFSDIRSNKFCDDLKLYDICFVNNNLPLVFQSQQRKGKKGNKNRQEQTENSAKNAKRISHIIPEKEYILNVIKIYQALQSKPKPRALFVDPDETVDIQRQIIDAFGIQHYTILVIVCNKTMEGNAVTDMCDKVTEILENYKYKRVILIAEKESSLARQLKKSNANDYEAITDSIIFSDLEISTQEKFKKKKNIHFQDKTTSLEELFKPSTIDDLNTIANSEILVKLARDDRIEAGQKLKELDSYYIYRSFNRDGRNIPEEDMCCPGRISEERVILISDSAGMGKSTVLTSLAKAIKRHNPHLWVVRIDLNSYTNIMKTSTKKGAKVINIVDILNSQEGSEFKSEFENKLFSNRKRVVLMLDGVDEVCPNYTDLVLNLLKDSLAQLNFAKILVTTRPHLCEELEQVLKVQSFTLEPFSEENQTDFLTKYWTEELHLHDDKETRKCESYAKALIKEMSRWIDDKAESTFAGIPLQTRMLAEVFQEENQVSDEKVRDWEGCKEFLSSDHDVPKLPKRINLIQLYDMFIEKKRDIFLNDKSNPGGGAAAESALNEKFEECHMYHRSLALKIILYSDEWQLFTCHTDIEECSAHFIHNFLLRVGIVQLQGVEINFIHRTFTEYFVAECILMELKQERENEGFQEFLIDEVLMRDEFYVVRAFFDSFVQRELSVLPDQTLLSYCSIANTSILASRDTYFHLFAMEGCAGILSFFLKCIDFAVTGDREMEGEQGIYVNATNLDCTTPLHEAAYRGHLSVIKILVERGADVDLEDANEVTALHLAVLGGNLDVVTFLVDEAGADISKTNTYGESVLYTAAQEGHLKLVEFFHDKCVDIRCEFSTALHAAAYRGHLEVVKFLVDETGIDVNAQDVNGCTVLHAAAQEGRMEVVEFLADRQCDINVLNNDVVTAFHAAIYRMHLQVVSFLINRGADCAIEDIDGDNILDIIGMIQENDVE